MNKSIVITGGSGFVGRSLIESLLSKNKVLNVDTIDHKEKNIDCDYLNADLRKPLKSIPTYKGATVIHTAAVMNAKNLDEFWKVNAIGTKNILDWSVKHKATHFIYISSGSVYGYSRNILMKENDFLNPIGAYGYTKWLGENLSQMYYKIYHLPVTIVRLYFPYGPGQVNGIFKLILKSITEENTLTIKKNGSPKFQPIHIEDVKTALMKIVNNYAGYRVYNLCGDIIINFLQLVKLIETECKKKAKLKYTEDDEGDLLADNTKIKKELDWNPSISIVSGIQTIL